MAVAVSGWLVAAFAGAELAPVPEPPLGDLTPAVRQQLAEARGALEVAENGEEPTTLAEAYGRLGGLYLLYEFTQSAAPSLENAVALRPEGWRDRYLLGCVYQQTGRFEEALEAFQAVLASRPEHVPSLLRSGEVQLRLRRLEGAMDVFGRATRLAPGSAAAHYGFGRVHGALRRWAEAAHHLERALELQPHADALWHPLARARRQLKDLAGAKDALRRAGDSRPLMDDPPMAELTRSSRLARTFLQQGDRARRRGLAEAALGFYRRALELDAADAGVRYNLGTLLGELGRLGDAEEQFRAAIRIEPERADFHYNLAISLRQRGQLDEAAEAFRRAAELAPEDLGARLELAATLEAASRPAAARDHLAAVVAAWPRSVELTLRLVRYQTAMGDPSGAARELERAWLAAPPLASHRSEIRRLQAELAERRGERRRSAELFEESVALDPSSGPGRLALASFLARQGRFAEAGEHFVVATSLLPKDERPVLGGTAAWMLAGRAAEALDLLRTGLERQPESATILLALAKLLATAGEEVRDGGAALELAQHASRLSPGVEAEEVRLMALAASNRFAEARAGQQRLVERASAVGAPVAVLARLRANLDRYAAGELAIPPW